ncbi:MAG: hypothetical protein ACFFCM_08215 [Promethearchaeota archaeon]
MTEVYIFDIDGCIMPPIFTNFNDKEPRKNVVKEIIKNGNQVDLFPEFINFYKRYCVHAESIYFITGRKYSEFGKLTENQLKYLKAFKIFHIIYYPEKKAHKIQEYFKWKLKEIKKIIKKTVKNKNSHETSQEKVKFYIFDDMENYFPNLRKINDHLLIQIHLRLIDSETSWNFFNL